jgi:hypothetical protein
MEAKGRFIGKTLGGAGKLLSGACVVMADIEGWQEQQKLDANRSHLSPAERGIRSGVRAGMVAGGGVLGAAACDALCGMAGAWVGQKAGNWLADRTFDVVDNVDWSPEGKNFGEKAKNLAKDFGSALENTFNPFD